MKDLVDLARAKPGTVTFSSAGIGTSGYLAAELLKAKAGLDISHVPYKSGPEAVTGVISGNVTFIFFTLPSLLPQVESGQLRALAIASANRSALVPNVPTITEAGFPGFDVIAWFALFAPRGTPAPVVARLSAEIKKIVAMDDVRTKMAKLGAEPKYLSPEGVADFVAAEAPTWRDAAQGHQAGRQINAAAGVMRLAEHGLYAYRLPYERPVAWSDIVEDAAPFVLLRLTADTGAVGVAEITVKPTWCGVTARSLVAALEDIFIPLLKTLELSDPAKVRAKLDAIPENQAAKALIDNACWDLYAAQSGCPLWQNWNGRANVELSWAVTRQAPAAMALEAERMVARYGFRVLKVKGGQGFERDLAGIRAIRSAVGDTIRFYVDANGAYPIDMARDYARALAAEGRRSVGRSLPACARCVLPGASAEQHRSDSGGFRLHVVARRNLVS